MRKVHQGVLRIDKTAVIYPYFSFVQRPFETGDPELLSLLIDRTPVAHVHDRSAHSLEHKQN